MPNSSYQLASSTKGIHPVIALIMLMLLFNACSERAAEGPQTLQGPWGAAYSKRQFQVKTDSGSLLSYTLHTWVPIRVGSQPRMTYRDHIRAQADTTDNEPESTTRQTIEYFFGKVRTTAWDSLMGTPALSIPDTALVRNRFPLIIGMLRPFSTTNTCEWLATQGYVVAMIAQVQDFAPSDSLNWNRQMRLELALYEEVILQLNSMNVADSSSVGLLGFSGSGFSQFLYAMNNPQAKCIALLESGVYAEGLFDAINRSGFYNPGNLTMPLLYFHNYFTDSTDLYRGEFDRVPEANKLKVLYRDSTMHHWDYASEGYVSSRYLGNRSPKVAVAQLKNFLNANARLIDFFDLHLKQSSQALTKRLPAHAEVLN